MTFLAIFFIIAFSAIIAYCINRIQDFSSKIETIQNEVGLLSRDSYSNSKSIKELINLNNKSLGNPITETQTEKKTPLDSFYKLSSIPGSPIEKEIDYYIECIKSKCRGKYIRRVDLPIITNRIVHSKAIYNAEYSRNIHINKITVGRFCIYPVEEFLEWLRGYILYGTGILSKFRKEFPYKNNQEPIQCKEKATKK